MNLALLNPRLWLGVACAVLVATACWVGYNWVYDRGAEHIQAKWDAVEKERAEALLVQTQQTLKTNADLQAAASKRQGESNAQIAALNSNLGRALDGLSNRPARPDSGGLPQPAGAGAGESGCTGAGLYRGDGEFLARYARDAAELRVGLKACYTQYGDARAALLK